MFGHAIFASVRCICIRSLRSFVLHPFVAFVQFQLRAPHVLYYFTSKCAFRHSGVHFFNMSTYRSGPNTSCFVHFVHFDFRIAPELSTSELQKVLRGRQFFNIFTSATAACIFSTSARTKVVQTRHVLYILHILTSELLQSFRHQNFKKCSEDVSFLTFSLPNVLFATAACIFSTSELTKVDQTRQFFNIFTSECAFRHSRVHIFNISFYKTGPNTSVF